MPQVLQVVLLRDGLLIGTEVFLPGEYTVGAGNGCDLRLDGASVVPVHARLRFRDGKVAVQAAGGTLFVNGTPVKSAALRPVDDLGVGAFTLKVRVVGTSAPRAVERAVPRVRLFCDLYWGEQRQQTRSFPMNRPVIAGLDDRAAMPLWGFPLAGGTMTLADGFRVFIPPAAAVEKRDARGDFQPFAARDHVDLQCGDAVRFTSEQTALVVSVAEPMRAPFVNPLRGLPHLAMGLTAALTLAFAAFVSFAPTEDEADFVLKALPRPDVKLAFLEKPKNVQPPAVASSGGKATPPKGPRGPRLPPRPHPRDLPFGGQSIAAVLGGTLPQILPAGPGKRPGRVAATAGLPGGTGSAAAFGLGAGATQGLGALGKDGIGAMGAGSIGKGTVGGRVGKIARNFQAPAGDGIDKNAVAKVIESHLHEVSSCYERALLGEKEASGGKLTLEWGLSTRGDVTFVKSKFSSMRTGSVEGCIIRALKGWRFPPAKRAGVLITYPFLFNAVGY